MLSLIHIYKEISIVYQAISQLQENSLTFFELDAHLNKGDKMCIRDRYNVVKLMREG